MSSPAASRLLRHAARNTAQCFLKRQQSPLRFPVSKIAVANGSVASRRSFMAPARRYAGIMPDTEDPKPRDPDPEHEVTQPTEISDEKYHARSEEYMNRIHEKAEAVQEGREDVEVEHSAGVLSITFPPAGTYIINKQPANKQIWLSSPTSGPKRFDWVLKGESMHEKEGGGAGDWVYIRDGTSLADLLRRELGISVDVDGHEEGLTKGSVDPTE